MRVYRLGLQLKDERYVQSQQTCVWNEAEQSPVRQWVVVKSCLVEGKVVSVLNQLPRHEDVWGSRGSALCILDLGTKWSWTIRFNPERPLGRNHGGPRKPLSILCPPPPQNNYRLFSWQSKSSHSASYCTHCVIKCYENVKSKVI
jgi:hypothetical protein